MTPPGDWSDALPLVLSLACGYLLGSIPFGLILTKLAGGGDVRKIGSGNIGATNVLRTGNKPLAALTLLLDVAKGTAAVWLGAQFGPGAAILAGLGAFLGHLFPVWLGFRGGKGVATYIGVALGLYWPAALAFCALWLLVAVTTRYSSLAALVASAATVATLAITGRWPLVALFGVLTILLYIRHGTNIGRLMKGQETRIGQSKQTS
ncbi:MAG: glycerol-3-phosphate 1-O-acyltransferase PlsY [Methyloceanibacter sp.]|jgi:glycerol-3-phosphate acyltransferase PlsY